jgi:hypothetical protein
MGNVKSPAPDQWKVYPGMNGLTQYVSLVDVIGVKFPDEATGTVTLRLANGHFVTLDKSVSLATVLKDLNAISGFALMVSAPPQN